MSSFSTISIAFDVKRRLPTPYLVLRKPEVVFDGQTVAGGSYIVLKSTRKSGTANSFMWFPPHSYLRFRVHASWPSFIAFLQSIAPEIASLDNN